VLDHATGRRRCDCDWPPFLVPTVCESVRDLHSRASVAAYATDAQRHERPETESEPFFDLQRAFRPVLDSS
jgi:hypothetical protein